jgi:tRNA pseudouridine13 synthase
MVILKQTPSDFIVTEITNKEPKEKGVYCYFWLTKTNLTTQQAVEKVAKALNTKKIGFAGNKDKHAVTKQLCSAYKKTEEQINSITINNITLKFFGYGDTPISLGDLNANRFQIIVRDIDEKERNNFQNKSKTPMAIVNYFDEQRFSTSNVDIGRAIVKKYFKIAVGIILNESGDYNGRVKEQIEKNSADFIGALIKIPKKILRIIIHSYQSWLWNETAAEYIKQKTDQTDTLDYSQGTFVFPKKEIKNTKIPLIGFDTECEDEELNKIIKNLLQKENITPREFIIRQLPELSCTGETRQLLIEVTGLTQEQDENSIMLSFTLPKGSYATIVIKYLFEAN